MKYTVLIKRVNIFIRNMSNDASVYLKSPFDMMNIKYENVEFPRSTMNKIANEIVPNHKLTNDGRELIANCCKEFIQLISSRASQLCSVQNKTYLTREHVLMGKFSIFVLKL